MLFRSVMLLTGESAKANAPADLIGILNRSRLASPIEVRSRINQVRLIEVIPGIRPEKTTRKGRAGLEDAGADLPKNKQ